VWNRRKSTKLNVLVVSGLSAALDLLCPMLDEQPGVSCVPFRPQKLSLECSAEQHLINNHFESLDNDNGTICVGLRYGDIDRCNLWEFIEQQSRLGDFCVVHVYHNPLLTAMAELQITDVSRLDPEGFATMTDYVSQCERIELKLNSSARDRVVLSYTELLLDYRRSCRRILTYLEQRYAPNFPSVSTAGVGQLRRLLHLQVLASSQRELLAGCRQLVPHLVT